MPPPRPIEAPASGRTAERELADVRLELDALRRALGEGDANAEDPA